MQPLPSSNSRKPPSTWGPPGRDLTYGFGLVGADYRIDPAPLITAEPAGFPTRVPGSQIFLRVEEIGRLRRIDSEGRMSASTQEYEMSGKQLLTGAAVATYCPGLAGIRRSLGWRGRPRWEFRRKPRGSLGGTSAHWRREPTGRYGQP